MLPAGPLEREVDPGEGGAGRTLGAHLDSLRRARSERVERAFAPRAFGGVGAYWWAWQAVQEAATAEAGHRRRGVHARPGLTVAAWGPIQGAPAFNEGGLRLRAAVWNGAGDRLPRRGPRPGRVAGWGIRHVGRVDQGSAGRRHDKGPPGSLGWGPPVSSLMARPGFVECPRGRRMGAESPSVGQPGARQGAGTALAWALPRRLPQEAR